MSFCQNCGNKLNKSAKFCEQCGQQNISKSNANKQIDVKKNNTKKIVVDIKVLAIIILALALVAVIGGIATSTLLKKQSPEQEISLDTPEERDQKRISDLIKIKEAIQACNSIVSDEEVALKLHPGFKPGDKHESPAEWEYLNTLLVQNGCLDEPFVVAKELVHPYFLEIIRFSSPKMTYTVNICTEVEMKENINYKGYASKGFGLCGSGEICIHCEGRFYN